MLSYLRHISENLIKASNVSLAKKAYLLELNNNAVIGYAANLYLAAQGMGKDTVISSLQSTSSTAAAYQPTFTVINMTPCPVKYTLFIGTDLAGCASSNDVFYPIDGFIHSPVGTTVYANGFASFVNQTWYPTYQTTQELVNQGLTAYYESIKYDLGNDCSSVSIATSCPNSPGISNSSQVCSGCNNNGTYTYTAVIYETTGTNPDAPNTPGVQNVTVMIMQN